uniref:Translation initiation factor eIF2B subunit beta n=1 Tax=Populus trichocarpa TaxID=3694 RepID=A0A2K1YQ43_POPTR|eukprot:XP_002314491.3 translation initiation factor eIF-2B subunit beta [Populus trichocarpa]
MPGTQILVNELVTKLRKRKVEGSQATALLTAELLRSVISQLKVPQTNQAETLIEAVKSVGEQLVAANPVELAVGNIVKRVLHVIREEDFSVATNALRGLVSSAGGDNRDTAEQKDFRAQNVAAVAAGPPSRPPSLHSLLDRTPDSAIAHHSSYIGDSFEGKGKSADRNTEIWKLKHDVKRAVNELIEDINSCHEQIAEHAVELIHQNEIILTFGRSRTVREFLCAAKEKRSFRVFVAEGAPKYQGHALAKDLVARGLQTTLITDSAVFAMISRVNMVVVGVHAVMANGGVLGPVGLNMVALAARKHAVPFVVVAGTHKLCPLYPQNPQVLLNEMRCPSELLQYGEFSDCMDFSIGSGNPLLNVVNPAFDYVSPELVSLFITDIGGYNPSFMHRLIADYYSADDVNLPKKTTS